MTKQPSTRKIRSYVSESSRNTSLAILPVKPALLPVLQQQQNKKQVRIEEPDDESEQIEHIDLTRRTTVDRYSNQGSDFHESQLALEKQQQQKQQSRVSAGHYFGRGLAWALVILVSITLFSVVLSCATQVHLNVMQVRNKQLSYIARLSADHCVYNKEPGAERFRNRPEETKRYMDAGFLDCKEADEFLSTVVWRYISAVIQPFSVCSSLESCHVLFWDWVVKISGFFVFSGAGYYILPLIFQSLFPFVRR